MGCLKLSDWLRHESVYMPQVTLAIIYLWIVSLYIKNKIRNQEPRNKANLEK